MSEPTPEQERQQKLAVVGIGIEAERFITSPLGRYIVNRAEQERERALEALVKADPHEVAQVQQLQNAVKVIDAVQQWIADAITEGAAMEQSLVAEDVEAGGGPPSA